MAPSGLPVPVHPAPVGLAESRPGALRLVGCPRPFSTERIDDYVPEGSTVEELVAIVAGNAMLRRHAHVFIDDWYIPRDKWAVVRPRAGRTVIVRVVAGDGGGGGKNPLRTVLMIAVIAAAMYAAPLLAAELGAEGFGLAFAKVAIGAAIATVGMMLVNAIAPPAKPNLDQLSGTSAQDSPTLFIGGSANQEIPFGVVPRVHGKFRSLPPLGAKTYTETVGDDQYFRMLVVWGYGPLSIADIKIGETPIGEFNDVEIETRQGYDADAPLTLFTNDVFEEPFSIELTQAVGYQTRTSQNDAEELSVDITFPQGLVAFNDQGGKGDFTVAVDVEYSPTGANVWTLVGTITTTARRTSAIRTGKRWAVAKGKYDVRLRRTTADTESSQISDTVGWTALRTIRHINPVAMTGLAMTAMRIKATGQLNGPVSQLNAIVQSLLPDWDEATQTWIERPTSNPASHYRAVLIGKANERRLALSRVDDARLAEWWVFCRDKGLNFNMIVDFETSVRQTLDTIAAAGRAVRVMRNNKWSVAIDRPQTVPVQHFSPRNSWGFSGQKVFADLPHAWKCRFSNRDKDYKPDVRIVPFDGYTEATATKLEELQLPGCDNGDEAWLHGRYHAAAATLRPEVYTLNTDIEWIVAERGDLAVVQHDVPLWGVAAGRVTALTLDVNDNVAGVVLDETVLMEAGKTYNLRVRKRNGDSLVVGLMTTPGENNALAFSVAIPPASAPDIDDLAMFGETARESVELLVKSIQPGIDHVAKITFVDAAPAIHDADTGAIPPFNSNVTLPPATTMPAVTAIRSDETVLLRDTDGNLHVRIVLSLLRVPSGRLPYLSEIQAFYRRADGGAWSYTAVAPDAVEIAIADVDQGETYELKVRYTKKDGTDGPFTAVFTHTVIGKSSPPPNVTEAWVENGKLRWAYPTPPPDLEGWLVRSRAGNEPVWTLGQPAHDGVLTSNEFDASSLPAGTRALMVKAVDTSGNVSVDPAVVVVNLGDVLLANVVRNQDEHAAGFPGPVTGGSVIGGDLVASDNNLYLPNPDDLYLTDGAALYLPGDFDEMVYTATVTVLSADLPARMTIEATIQGTWSIAYRFGASGVFRPWTGELNELEAGNYQFQFTTAAGSVGGLISAMVFHLDVPDVDEVLTNVAISALGTRLPLAKSYRAILRVGLTLREDGGSAVTVRAIDYDAVNGPLIKCFDTANAATTGHIDAHPQGY